ncbi:ankyrin repeat-containing domain protein [Aspergillus insuetus]
MHLPTEILLLIISEAEHTLSALELFKARLVNKLFADEIIALPKTTTFLDAQYSEKWETMPGQLRHFHLRRKIKQHNEHPCELSHHVNVVIDGCPETLNTEASRDVFIGKVIDCMRWEVRARGGIRAALTTRPDFYEYWDTRTGHTVGNLNTAHEDMRLVLVCSAIIRGEAVELDQLLSDPRNSSVLRLLYRWSARFDILGVRLAAQHGTKETIKVLIKHGARRDPRVGSPGLYPIAYAARYGNKLAIEAWIEDPDALRLDRNLENAMRVALQKRDLAMVQFLAERYPGGGGGGGGGGPRRAKFLYEACIVAIQYGQVDLVRHFLDRGGFDLHMRTDRFQLGLLMTTFFECGQGFIYPLVRLLLEHGFDPNYIPPEPRSTGVTGTPLQRACILGNVEVAEALVEYGADLNASSIGKHGRWNGVCSPPPLWHATRQMNGGEIVRILLENGANPLFRLRWKTVLMKVGEDIQGVEEPKSKDVLWRGKDSTGRSYSLVVAKFHRRKESRKKEKAMVAAMKAAALD